MKVTTKAVAPVYVLELSEEELKAVLCCTFHPLCGNPMLDAVHREAKFKALNVTPGELSELIRGVHYGALDAIESNGGFQR